MKSPKSIPLGKYKSFEACNATRGLTLSLVFSIFVFCITSVVWHGEVLRLPARFGTQDVCSILFSPITQLTPKGIFVSWESNCKMPSWKFLVEDCSTGLEKEKILFERTSLAVAWEVDTPIGKYEDLTRYHYSERIPWNKKEITRICISLHPGSLARLQARVFSTWNTQGHGNEKAVIELPCIDCSSSKPSSHCRHHTSLETPASTIALVGSSEAYSYDLQHILTLSHEKYSPNLFIHLGDAVNPTKTPADISMANLLQSGVKVPDGGFLDLDSSHQLLSWRRKHGGRLPKEFENVYEEKRIRRSVMATTNEQWKTGLFDPLNTASISQHAAILFVHGDQDEMNHQEVKPDAQFFYAVPHVRLINSEYDYLLNVIVLDSTLWETESGNEARQFHWLQQHVSSEEYKNSKFRIVMVHSWPTFGEMERFSSKNGDSLKPAAYNKMFREHGVNAVFFGSRHQYERWSYQGITYICSGGGGGRIDKTEHANSNVVTEGSQHMVAIQLFYDRLHVEMMSISAEVFDTIDIVYEGDL